MSSRLGTYVLTILCASMLTLTLASPADAASFYWYGEAPDCWQTGSPGAPNRACDYPGGGKLPENEAVSADIHAPQSGDWCNVYFVNNTLCNNENATWPLSFKYTSRCATDSPA